MYSLNLINSKKEKKDLEIRHLEVQILEMKKTNEIGKKTSLLSEEIKQMRGIVKKYYYFVQVTTSNRK